MLFEPLLNGFLFEFFDLLFDKIFYTAFLHNCQSKLLILKIMGLTQKRRLTTVNDLIRQSLNKIKLLTCKTLKTI